MSGYRLVEDLLAAERCVVLDGGVATELQRLGASAGGPDGDPELWGTWAITTAPDAVRQVHAAYAAAGCHVVSTNTWSPAATPDRDVAARAVRLAREGVDGHECTVAFAISGAVDSPDAEPALERLRLAFDEEPPDLVLLETLTLVRDPGTFETVRRVVDLGLPVWVSFRRCRHGVCGVHGEHWGPPEGDTFGHAARRFEELGVAALLVNCLPIDHVQGMLSWLRDFTGLPLGAYANLGHLAGPLWRFDERVRPEDYAALARGWRAEGARIVGGCCGTTPEHVAAVAEALANTEPGDERRPPAYDDGRVEEQVEPWRDERGRVVFPLPFPELVVEPGVFVPTQGSYVVWKHLVRTGTGDGLACVDVGCGSGILAVQLALNGASSVHAIDLDPKAVENTLANAERNGVGARVTGHTADLFDWEPERSFDVVVASLYQLPVDPYSEPIGHRPLDYWGRTQLDHFLRLLPRLLAPDGAAYVMQLSIIGQQATERLLSAGGLQARVVDFSFFPFGPLFERTRPQIERVEELSDAYHVSVGGEDVMVAYLLEVTHR